MDTGHLDNFEGESLSESESERGSEIELIARARGGDDSVFQRIKLIASYSFPRASVETEILVD